VNDRIRLHQAAVKRQVLFQARNLTLHIAEIPINLLVALLIDAPRDFGGLQLGGSRSLSFSRLRIRCARRECAAH